MKQENIGIKENSGKLDYSEINFRILDIMAQRFEANKFKYPKGNSKKKIDIEQLQWALFRHIKKIVQPIEGDIESKLDHLAAIACNISMILDQLELLEQEAKEKPKIEFTPQELFDLVKNSFMVGYSNGINEECEDTEYSNYVAEEIVNQYLKQQNEKSDQSD